MARLPRRSRRRPLIAAGAGALVIATGAIAFVASDRSRSQQTPDTPARRFASVRRTDLTATSSFTATVASQAGPKVTNRSDGTVTAMAASGAAIGRGGTLYSVDGTPVVLMFGAVPAWRDIGFTSTGADVRQLEENLSALGYSPGSVDETFTATTASAVRAWQTAAGLTSDGIARLGQIVFATGPLRVDRQQASVGAPIRAGEPVMTTLSSAKIALVAFEDSASLAAGDAVTIVLSDGTDIPATVSSIDSGTDGEQTGGSQTATVTPKNPGMLGELKDGDEVTVTLVTDTRKGVLAVPVTALLARAGGGYSVEVSRAGRTTLVPVEPGLYADELVEVTGEVHEGDRVVVP